MNHIHTIQQLALKYFDRIREVRRHIHRHPELSYQEKETSAYICKQLDHLGISYRKGIAGYGIVADIEGKAAGRTIGLRADMDALPILENPDRDYCSVHPGVMHACGHDVHTACLLGAAMILMELKGEFNGRIRLVFQPGEEKAPGGARLMLEAGLFGDDPPELMLAQHVYPSLPAGTVGFKAGKYMASSDEIFLKIKGKGGHAAMPHQTIDSVLIAAHILVALQQIVSRYAEASIPTVLSFGRLIADGAMNVIPSEVTAEGTFRTMDETWRKEAHRRMKQIACSIAESMGGQCEFRIVQGYPALVNDEALAASSKQHAVEYLGKESVKDLGIRMTAEDFAFFARNCPAVLYRLGIHPPGEGEGPALHTPDFDIDEEAMKTGSGLMAWLALSQLI